MGAHYELSKSSNKKIPPYILSQYGYFGKYINFSKVLHVQQVIDEEAKMMMFQDWKSFLLNYKKMS